MHICFKEDCALYSILSQHQSAWWAKPQAFCPQCAPFCKKFSQTEEVQTNLIHLQRELFSNQSHKLASSHNYWRLQNLFLKNGPLQKNFQNGMCITCGFSHCWSAISITHTRKRYLIMKQHEVKRFSYWWLKSISRVLK